MRLANFEEDFWQLRSAEESHRKHRETFWIPSAGARHGLERGMAAQLIFDLEAWEADGTVGRRGERMWVTASEKVGELYIGVLDNAPAWLAPEDIYLCLGAEVPFGPEHVIDIAYPPQEYVDWQLGQPPERTWPRD